MLENALIDRPVAPTDVDVGAALGAAKAVWDELLADLARDAIADTRAWKSHSPKWGWSLRVLKKKRTIAWLSPGAVASIARAIDVAHAALTAYGAAVLHPPQDHSVCRAFEIHDPAGNAILLHRRTDGTCGQTSLPNPTN